MHFSDFSIHRDRFIYTFTFVGVSSTLVFGVMQHLKVGNYASALFELFLSLIGLFNAVYYSRKRNYDLASTTILVLMVTMLSFLSITGGLGGTGLYWIYTFPLLAFFMKPIRQAFVWNGVLILSILTLYWLGQQGVINFFYNWSELRQALGAYMAVLLLSLFYSLILNGLLRDLKTRATVDMLTGLHNRAFVFDTLAKLIDMVKRKKDITYCLAYLDLDNFKRVNDLYGHGEGDSVLREVAQIIQGSFRSGDVVGRIGGDEFIIIVYDCKKQAFLKRLEKIRRRIEGTFSRYGLSLSYGVVVVPEEGTDINMVLKLADKRMYDMKRRKKELNYPQEEKV